MADRDDHYEVRSYRNVFDLERRIHRLERWRLPLPYGLPLRSVGYYLVAVFLMLLLGKLPGIGGLIDGMHPALRFGGLPISIAWVLTEVRVDGRTAHGVGVAWLAYTLAPKRLVAYRPCAREQRVELGEVTFAPDEESACYRRARVKGPVRILLRYPADVHVKRKRMHVTQVSRKPMWRGKQVELAKGAEVVFE